jgi:quercetin dioxygenase-like cupin family protein
MTDKTGKLPRRLPHSEAIDLASLAEYAEDSIVSRTVTESSAGTVTLFAFDAGQTISEHSAPFDAILQVVEGRAEVIVGGKRLSAGPGQAVIMPANAPHTVKAPQRFKMLLTMLRSGEEQ